MKQERALQLFQSLSEKEQIAILKKLIRKRIDDSECWAKADMRTLVRIFRILSKPAP